MKNFVFNVMLCLAPFAARASDALSAKRDPILLAAEQKTEYAHYLKSIFDRAVSVPVQKVATSPQFRKGSPGYPFRSEIRRQAKVEEANFAGDWILAVVGCGTGCNQYFLVQAKTGAVVDPHLMSTNGNPLFVKDKNLLVTGGSIGEKTLADAEKGVWGGPRAWVWKKGKFEEVPL